MSHVASTNEGRPDRGGLRRASLRRSSAIGTAAIVWPGYVVYHALVLLGA
ncbi:hypothetical protein [Agromyces bauzanensis]